MPDSAREPAFTRPEFGDITLYDPDRRPARVDLSDNTNRWGMAPAVRAALRDASEWSAVRYPALYAQTLKRALAEYAGVDVGNIVTGCGSDDVLDSAIRACGRVGGVIAAPTPVFPMIPLFARMNGLSFAPVPIDGSYCVDAEALVAPDPDVVYMCSPNNPTGTTLPARVVVDILARSRALVIVDEAYIEFGGASAVGLVRESPRLLVVRTMSKAFGLAGLRVGYAIGAPALVAAVEKSRGPYKVNALAERAAVAALTDGLSWARDRVADVIALRAALTEELAGRGLVALPSSANFVFVPVSNAGDLAAMMREMGVAVRPFIDLESNIPALRATRGSALRISIGPRAELDAALAALDQARAACS